jgi:hypothetical protein
MGTTRDEIQRAILKVAGDPDSGSIRDLSGDMADAVWQLLHPSKKETRIIHAEEKAEAKLDSK